MGDDRRPETARREPPAEDTVRRIARAALRGTRPVPGDGAADGRAGRPAGGGPGAPDVRPRAAGGGFSWWIGRGHVLRLAPDMDASVRLRREMRLRELVRPYVRVPLPVGVAAGTWAGGLGYTLDTRLPGAPAGDRIVSAPGESDLADLLAGLGAVPVPRATALQVPVLRPRSLRERRAEAVAAARSLAGEGPPGAGRFAPLTPHGAAQLTAARGDAVVHGGLTGQRLLVTGDGRVCGVLGWAGAAIGDPAEDIACLACSLGAPIAVRAATLAGYGPRMCLRGLWLARCDSVIRLAARHRERWPAERGSDGDLRAPDDDAPPLPALRAQLQRAWEPILLERLSGEEPGAV
jgi:aminoglycoside phosphotransferase (APT) family kinase protein